MTDSALPRIRVLIADDQRVVREGLVALVGLFDGVDVVGSVPDGAAAVSLALETHPDIILMDLRMPELDGVEATRRIVAETDARVVVLTTYADDQSVFPALRAGASGFLTKDESAEHIEAAIRAVQNGQTWLDPLAQERLVAALGDDDNDDPERQPNSHAEVSATPDLPDGLTAREAEVLALIGDGLSNREIGERLVLGQATVKTHVNRIFAKTGVRDRAQAVRYAIRAGLTAPHGDS